MCKERWPNGVSWQDELRGLRASVTAEFGDPITYTTQNQTVAVEINAVRAEASDPGYTMNSPLDLVLKINRDDLAGLPDGDVVVGDYITVEDGTRYTIFHFLIDRRDMVEIHLRVEES